MTENLIRIAAIDSIEDGEVDDSKGLDPNRSYHMRISGRSAELYNDWGQFIRRFNMRTNVIQATTSGEMVAICADDGYTHIYKWDGTFMRGRHFATISRLKETGCNP